MKIENMSQRFSCISFLFKPPWLLFALPVTERTESDLVKMVNKSISESEWLKYLRETTGNYS